MAVYRQGMQVGLAKIAILNHYLASLCVVYDLTVKCYTHRCAGLWQSSLVCWWWEMTTKCLWQD